MNEAMDKELRDRYSRIGRTICQYYSAAPWPFEPTDKDYREWLKELCPNEYTFYKKLGFPACQAVNAFRQHWLERRGYYLKDYLRMHLNPQDYAIYFQRPVFYEEPNFTA
ncbi:MAG: hypothetical protein ACO1O2_20655 [Larkinella arboricola]